jgi:hypothetical protein
VQFVKKSISPESIVLASKEQISCDLAGEAAILELKSGTYFGLDEVGAVVWKLIAQPRRVTEIRDALLERYDVEADRCGRELIDLLGALHERGLIQIAEGHIDNDETDR